ncbi:MAG TPA: gas vesicle protein [Pyrinomonadaceae bacterium]|nr:gas vesicle protein [Pyrinomonadaceae bacterium]
MSFEQIIVSGNGEQLEESELSLLETLDHVLNRGLVIAGEITISVADIDLVFVGLNVLLSSVETANEVLQRRQTDAE